MQLTTFTVSLLALLAAPLAVLGRHQPWTRINVPSTWVTYYDSPGNSVDGVACGRTLKSKGEYTIGDIDARYLVAAPVVKQADDAHCGRCYKLSYYDKSLYAMVIDQSDEWDLSSDGFEYLGGNQGFQDGGLYINVTSARPDQCEYESVHGDSNSYPPNRKW